MQARIIRNPDDLHGLQAAWNDMLHDSPFQAPFHGWDWHASWWNAFGAADQLFVIAMEEPAGHLQAVAPLVKTRATVRGLPATEIRFFPYSLTPHSTILFRNGVTPCAAINAVFDVLAEHRGEWDLVNLHNVPATAAYLPFLEQAGTHHGFQVLSQPGMRSAVVDIHSDFLAYMSDPVRKGHKRGILQKVRQLSQRPDYRSETYSRPEDIERGLALAFEVSKSSWKGKLGTDMGGLESRRSFFQDVTLRLARSGEVRIHISFLGDTPIALHYHIVSRDTVFFLINDFREEHQKLSPGTVLLCQTIESLHRDPSAREFYFSGDLYDYKTHWATSLREHINLEIFNDRPYSRCLLLGKRAMPLLREMKDRMWAGVRRVFQGQAS